jgi:hypothetical protein
MASILYVYNTLKDLVNKDQKGFVSADEFNNLATAAQLDIYNNLFNDIHDSKRLKRQGIEGGRDKSLKKRIREDLAYFAKSSPITKTNGAFDKPDDVSRIISANTFGSYMLDFSTKNPIELLYDEEKIERILASNLSAPSEDYPVALVSDRIYIFPTSINKIQLRYYKIPQSVSPTGVRVAAPPIISFAANGNLDTTNYRDFELPNHYESDLIVRIATMIGLSLRDGDVTAFTASEAQNRANV